MDPIVIDPPVIAPLNVALPADDIKNSFADMKPVLFNTIPAVVKAPSLPPAAFVDEIEVPFKFQPPMVAPVEVVWNTDVPLAPCISNFELSHKNFPAVPTALILYVHVSVCPMNIPVPA